MPAPDLYDDGRLDPFMDAGPIEAPPYDGILYATDRELGESEAGSFYLNERGGLVRLGFGSISMGKNPISWEEARRISLLKNRTGKYPLKITRVEEIGILDRSITAFDDPAGFPEPLDAPALNFANLINRRLKISKRKDIYIYVHGYKVVFENPLLVATELWNFIGYDGVFIAYAWPSTPRKLAYLSDLETTTVSAHNLRVFLSYLADQTDAERIHIVGYSAGTRVVVNALQQLALLNAEKPPDHIRRSLRIGHVILVGSDIDRGIFGAYLADGLLRIPETVSIYVSQTDKALGLSKWIFGRNRIGQAYKPGEMKVWVREYLNKTPQLVQINVFGAEGAAKGNGHAYFRKSPWVSSDVIMTLMYHLTPGERGLVFEADSAAWTFPEDYIEKVRTAISEANPALTVPVGSGKGGTSEKNEEGRKSGFHQCEGKEGDDLK